MAATFGNTATTPSSVNSFSVVKRNDPLATISYPTPASTQINAGDALVWNSTAHCVALMSNIVWDTNLLTTQEDAAPIFLGFALGQKDVGDGTTTKIPVMTRGFAVLSAAAVNTIYDPGTFIAMAGQGTHNLSDFTAIVVGNILAAIGYMAGLELANSVIYGFFFQSSLVFGGLQSATP